MILLDTSVIVDYWRKPRASVEEALTRLRPCICGVVLAELLQGATTSEEADRTEKALAGFGYLDMPEEVWRKLGANLAALRTAGRPVPFQDALLATVAIAHDAELWTLDGHYAMIHAVLKDLRLLPDPLRDMSTS
jgi:predicted nucleic acid-binding protein